MSDRPALKQTSDLSAHSSDSLSETQNQTQPLTASNPELISLESIFESFGSLPHGYRLKDYGQSKVRVVTDARIIGNAIDLMKDIDERRYDDRTMLMHAVWTERADVVEILAQKGANINFRSNQGSSALAMALIARNLKITRILMAHGADRNIRFKHGQTALSLAIDTKRKQFLEAISGEDDPVQLLSEYIWINCTHIMEKVLKFWLKTYPEIVNYSRYPTYTLLMLSAEQRQRTSFMQILIEAGADLEVKTELGTTALGVAIERSNILGVQTLLDADAQVNTCGADKWTPLMIAAQSGNPEILKLLLDSGAKPSEVNEDGETALTIAAAHGKQRGVEMLIDHYEQQDIQIAIAAAQKELDDANAKTSRLHPSSNEYTESYRLAKNLQAVLKNLSERSSSTVQAERPKLVRDPKATARSDLDSSELPPLQLSEPAKRDHLGKVLQRE